MSTHADSKPWTVPALADAKRDGRKLVMLTAYDNSFARVLDAFSALDREQYDLVPIQSQAAYSTDTRFGAAADFRAASASMKASMRVPTCSSDQERVSLWSASIMMVGRPCFSSIRRASSYWPKE